MSVTTSDCHNLMESCVFLNLEHPEGRILRLKHHKQRLCMLVSIHNKAMHEVLERNSKLYVTEYIHTSRLVKIGKQ